MTDGWTRADRWRTELVRTAGAVPIDDVVVFGVALLDELAKRGTPHGALHPEVISVRHEGSALRVQIDPKSWPTNPTQEMALATGSKSMTARPGIHYRAPEQFTSRPEDVHGARMDCFAVGVMLYEIATGQLPFAQDAQQPFKVFLLLKRGGFPSLHQLRRDIPDALATAITSALALRADERTPDAATMASALRTLMRPPAPKVVPAPQVASRPADEHAPEPPTPARPAPDRSAVPLDPLRPIETGVLPVATQAAIATFRAGQAGQQMPLIRHRPELVVPTRPRPPEPLAEAGPPIPLGPPAQPAPVVTPTAPAMPTAPTPREVPLPIRAIVEAVTRREPPVPAPPRQPDSPVSAPIAAAPLAAPVTQQPIVMVPPRVAPSSKPIMVAPAPSAPRAPVEPVRERPLERTQVTGPPSQMERQLAPRPVEPLHIAPAAPGRIPEPLRVEPALLPSSVPTPVTPRTLPAPHPTQPLVEAGPAPPPRVERPVEPTPQVAPRRAGGQAPAQPTVIAPPPPALVRATAPAAWPPPNTVLPAPLVQPKPAAAPPRAPIAVPAPTPYVAPRPASVPAPAPVAAPDPPREDTAQRSNGEVTPPEGSARIPLANPTNRRAIVVLGGVLLLLGVGAGLLVQLPSRAAAPASHAQCVPGPERVCPPPEPVAMPDPTPVVCEPHKPCEPPKPSPKVECFYDGYSTGQRRYLRGDRRGALEAFHAAEACMPRNPRLLQWIGRCYEELRERDQARAYYERYLRRRPRADDADYYRKRLDALEHSNGGVPRDGGTR